MTIEQRLTQLESEHLALAAQHTALQFAFLALYPIGALTANQLQAAFTRAHALAETAMRAGDASAPFRQDVSEALECLSEVLECGVEG